MKAKLFSYEDQRVYATPSAIFGHPKSYPFLQALEPCLQRCNNIQSKATRPSPSLQPRPMQNNEYRVVLYMGIIPIPPPPNPPGLDAPPPKLLPLLLLLVDLRFVTPAEALPLPVLPDTFRLPFQLPLKLTRPLRPLRLFELS